jgi:nucleoid-associated protein EbfC
MPICCRIDAALTSQLCVHVGLSADQTSTYFTMAGLGKLVKQAEKMKRGIEALQTQLDAKEIDVTAGGGAVKIKINGSGKFLALTLDPEFLKEDPKLIGDTILAAVQDAAKQAKEYNEAEMQKITGSFQMPGLF